MSIGSLKLKIYFLPVNPVTKILMESGEKRSVNTKKVNGFEILICVHRNPSFLLFQEYLLHSSAKLHSGMRRHGLSQSNRQVLKQLVLKLQVLKTALETKL